MRPNVLAPVLSIEAFKLFIWDDVMEVPELTVDPDGAESPRLVHSDA